MVPLQGRGERASIDQGRVGVHRPEVSGCLYSMGNCGLYGAGVSGVSTEQRRG